MPTKGQHGRTNEGEYESKKKHGMGVMKYPDDGVWSMFMLLKIFSLLSFSLYSVDHMTSSTSFMGQFLIV